MGAIYLGNIPIYKTAVVNQDNAKKPKYINKEGHLYRLIFNDDFDENDINHNFWIEDYMPSRVQTAYNAYSDVRVEDSLLKLRIKRNMGCRDGTENGNTIAVSSIQSSVWNGMHLPNPTFHDFRPWYGFMYQEGYCEIKAKVCSGSGVHSSFWLIGTENTDSERCEIDVFEIFGNDITTIPFNIYPNGDTNISQQKIKINTGINLSNDFHTYGFLWDGNKVRLYFDKSFVKEIITPMPNYPLIMFMSLYKRQSGTGASGNYDPNLGDIETLVDYIKIYKKAESEKSMITVVSQNEITINVAGGNYIVDSNSGILTSMPLYVYLTWNDGTRTEHWIKWDRFDNKKKYILDNGGTLIWEGIAYGVGKKIVATINVN